MRMDGGPPAQPQNGCAMPLIEIDGSGITGIPAYMNGIGMAGTGGAAPRVETAATIVITAVRQCFSRRPTLVALCICGIPLMLIHVSVPLASDHQHVCVRDRIACADAA